MVQTRQIKKNQRINLISATRISNTVKNDKLLDYLDLLDENGLNISNELIIGKKRYLKDLDNITHFSNISNSTQNLNKKKKTSFDYIVDAGYLFEYDIINKIKMLMESKGELSKLINICEQDINDNCDKTIQIIKKNLHTIILGSVLINQQNNTWGKPDLIVKGEWIEKYINMKIENVDITKWYIIDIKSSTIQLINNGSDISSKLLYSVYKSQIYIYTQALNDLLNKYNINNNVSIGFILGKKYKYYFDKKQIIKNSFDMMGIVDFNKEKIKGIDLENMIKSGIEWIKDLRTNWKHFTLNPINKDELYPNMKNIYNKNWYGIKKNIANKNKELSLLWFCGITNRNKAWMKGIKSYMDKNLTPEILGFNIHDSKYKIIDNMLKLLHIPDKNYILDKKNNFMNWQQKAEWEFFIDFETYNLDTIYDESSDWNNIYDDNQKIYMCGISWICNDSNEFNHHVFIVDYVHIDKLKNAFINNDKEIKYDDCTCCSSELDLIIKIKEFIMKFKPNNMKTDEFFNKSRLIHWSCAEPVIFNKKINEYKLNNFEFKLNWYDLLNVFKYSENPIIIKECFGFGLKNIVRKLNEFKEITIEWADLDDGLLSSFIAKDIYTNNFSNEKELNKNMYDIIKYNLIDCKSMNVLIDWMRNSIK